jgi:hypothetical protein
MKRQGSGVHGAFVFFKRRKTDGLLAAAVLVVLFLFASYQPRLRLRAAMPPDFVDPDAGILRNDAERKIAQGYWTCLVDDVQWRYGFGHMLPGEPPAEFSLGMQGKDSLREDADTRIRYWRRAQHLWYVRSSWEERYEWNFEWIKDWYQEGAAWLHRVFEHIGGE